MKGEMSVMGTVNQCGESMEKYQNVKMRLSQTGRQQQFKQKIKLSNVNVLFDLKSFRSWSDTFCTEFSSSHQNAHMHAFKAVQSKVLNCCIDESCFRNVCS